MRKSYTGQGDDGTTARFGGARTSKASALPRATGALDEANAALGLALTLTENKEILTQIEQMQHMLFRIGADLSTPLDHPAPRARRISHEDTVILEHRIDALDQKLPELRNFILPGGTQCAAALHLARTIVRRAEREITHLIDARESLNPDLRAYINRLSSYLFALARLANLREGRAEKHPEY